MALLKSLSLLALLWIAAPAQAKVTRYLTGNAQDVNPTLAGPAHDLGGGGTDVDAAIQWLINQARGCTSCATAVDVVVLRSTGDDGYNRPISLMSGVDSVETLVITSPQDATRSDVIDTIQKAEVVFFAGGDQCDYVGNFKGNAIQTAVESVYSRGGTIGGTSAGNAIQGEFVYDACVGSVTSSQALRNPYHPYITFTDNFFLWRNFTNTLTDTHFVTRDRMGRLMAFLARQIQDGVTPKALGIGVNEVTSVIVDKNGLATVTGQGPAYFVLADHPPETCKDKTPLTYSNFKIWKVTPGGMFNLKTYPTNGYYLRSVQQGVINSNPY